MEKIVVGCCLAFVVLIRLFKELSFGSFALALQASVLVFSGLECFSNALPILSRALIGPTHLPMHEDCDLISYIQGILDSWERSRVQVVKCCGSYGGQQ